MCHLLGRLAYFAVIGVVAIVAIGPVVGVVGALLPFALIGGLAFAAYRGVRRLVGKRPIEDRATEPQLVELPREVVAPAAIEEAPRPQRPWRGGRVVVEVLSGGVVAGLVAAAIGWQSPELAGTVVPAVVAGAVVGYIVGGSSSEKASPAREAEVVS